MWPASELVAFFALAGVLVVQGLAESRTTGKSGGYRTTFCDALPRDLSLTTDNFGIKNFLLGQVFGSILFQQGLN